MRKLSIPFLVSMFIFFLSGNLFADGPCKGLSESKCNSTTECTWVKGYKKDSGAKVDDYCRAKPGKGDDDKDSKSSKKDKKKVEKEDKVDKEEVADENDTKSDKKDKKKKKEKKTKKDKKNKED